MIKRLILFTLINFSALAIGSIFTSDGVASLWYEELNKAPWTPPGWVFGFAWTSIMICFAFFLALLWPKIKDNKYYIYILIFQWILNILWNPIFFKFHSVFGGLIIISLLTIILAVMLYKSFNDFKKYSILIVPYFIWLLIATSLNAYIMFNN